MKSEKVCCTPQPTIAYSEPLTLAESSSLPDPLASSSSQVGQALREEARVRSPQSPSGDQAQSGPAWLPASLSTPFLLNSEGFGLHPASEGDLSPLGGQFSGFGCHRSPECQQPPLASTVTASQRRRCPATDYWDGSGVGCKLLVGLFPVTSPGLDPTQPRWGLGTLSTTGPPQLRMIIRQDPEGETESTC